MHATGEVTVPVIAEVTVPATGDDPGGDLRGTVPLPAITGVVCDRRVADTVTGERTVGETGEETGERPGRDRGKTGKECGRDRRRTTRERPARYAEEDTAKKRQGGRRRIGSSTGEDRVEHRRGSGRAPARDQDEHG